MSFCDIVRRIERGDVLDILEHPDQERYEGQRLFVVQIEDYVYLVPFVEEESKLCLRLSSRAVRRPRSTFARRSDTMKLDPKEKKIAQSVERGEWRSIPRIEVRLPPDVRQKVKTLFAVRCKSIVQPGAHDAKLAPVGEAETGSAGEQPAKE